jgi:hypothetical protein
VAAVEYYLWAVDDGFDTHRTRGYEIAYASAGCEFPVFDEDPERISRIVVNATSEKQGKKVEGFESRGVQFVPAGKKK